MNLSKAISALLGVVAGVASIVAFSLELTQFKFFFEEAETLFVVVTSIALAVSGLAAW